MKIWKLSHGFNDISEEQSDWLDENQYLTIYRDTAKSQGKKFVEQMRAGDLVCMSRSASLKCLVRLVGDLVERDDTQFAKDWVFRKYEILKSIPLRSYSGQKKGWTPNYNSTLAAVPKYQWSLFEEWILQPFFGETLENLGIEKGAENIDTRTKYAGYDNIINCHASAAFERFLNKRGVDKDVLEDAIRVVRSTADTFDLYNIDKAQSCLRFGHKALTDTRGKVAGLFFVEEGQLKLRFPKQYGRTESIRIPLTGDIQHNEKIIVEAINAEQAFFAKHGLTGNHHLPYQYTSLEAATNDELNDDIDETSATGPLNQIFYGPPGTGKTWYAIEAAVKAAEPGLYAQLGIDEEGATPEQRQKLTHLYKGLFDKGRIRFVTFHQSYGYEEFVEGLSAKTEGDTLSYFEKDGVFKQICDEAKRHRVAKSHDARDEFDVKWQQFSERLAESEDGIRIDTLSKRTYFTITDVSGNTIRFDKSKGSSVHSLTVKSLQALYAKEKEIKGGLEPYYKALVAHLKAYFNPPFSSHSQKKNLVLIIDEINRGNISKIFGELITLIEPSKRSGLDQNGEENAEALEVVLPYSGDKFSVPDNLYIIGTMNTADRSLALMDTALRRRFDFVEMMPDASVFLSEDGEQYLIKIDSFEIDPGLLLQTLNNRIAALYDREHMLGHAFFIPVLERVAAGDHDLAIEALKSCFLNKIIPLLAEYFFEDWQKIRMVLADNQKEQLSKQLKSKNQPAEQTPPDNANSNQAKEIENPSSMLPLIETVDISFKELFGDQDAEELGDEQNHAYQLANSDDDRWLDPRTYIGMYKIDALKPDALKPAK